MEQKHAQGTLIGEERSFNPKVKGSLVYYVLASTVKLSFLGMAVTVVTPLLLG